jgi:hypothetical protein
VDIPQFYVGLETARVLAFRPAAAPDYSAEISIQALPGAPEGCHVPVYACFSCLSIAERW